MSVTAPTLSHAQIDQRLLQLIEACVRKIDQNPRLLAQVRKNIARQPNPRIRRLWTHLLNSPWAQLREQLTEVSERGARLRQDAPFAGILTDAERLAIFRRSSV